MKVLRYEAPRQARIVESTPPRAMGKQSVARTLMTSISAGTEMGFYRGTAPQIHSRTDQHQLFHAAPHHVTYPMQSDEPGVWWMGYSAVGCVVEVGPDETNLCNGDLVWAQQGHKSMMVSDRFVRLPPDIDIARASFLALLDIAFNGMLDARVKLLDEVTVFGMGTLGLLLLQMCRRSGARVTAVDSLATRLELAVKLGAHRVLNPTTEGDVGVRVQEATGGRGADVVFEVTGNVDALPHAIRCAGYEGSVTVLSFYQRGAASLELGKEFHHKRITLRSSQVGGFNPDLRHQYNCQRRQEQSIWLAQNLELLPLISHRVPFEELPEALRVIDANPSACQSIVITYT